MKKPTPEAKALSLFLMAFKKSNPVCKDKAKRINRQWDLVQANELDQKIYDKEVQEMLAFFGGYSTVVEKTVEFYVKKTGEWTLQGNDKFCVDAQIIADKLLKK
jgi:hypothetical protein